MKCAMPDCGKTIPQNRYRWVAGYRKADGVIGPKGFEAEFCSASCFLVGAEGVEAWNFEQMMFQSLKDAGEIDEDAVEFFISPLII